MLIDPQHGAGLFLPGIEGEQVATDGCNRRALRGALNTCRQWLARPEDRTQLSFECLGTVLLAIGYAAVYWHLNRRRRYSRRENLSDKHSHLRCEGRGHCPRPPLLRHYRVLFQRCSCGFATPAPRYAHLNRICGVGEPHAFQRVTENC